MNPNEFGVASGWYPDPLGLPQLRWWDGQSWAEHTSEARAPIVEKVSAYADVAFESRRAARERERERAGSQREFTGDADFYEFDDYNDDGDVTDGGMTDDDLDGIAIDDLAEGNEGYGASFDGTMPDDPTPTAADDFRARGLREMTLNEFGLPPEQDDDPVAEKAEGAEPTYSARRIPADPNDLAWMRAPAQPLRSYTVSVWLLSVIPLLQLISMLVLVPVAGLGNNWPLVVSAWIAPHIIAIGLAAHDRLTLTLWGHRHPASPRWALLMAVSYLVVRARRVRHETGHGSPLLLIVGLSFAALFGACVAIPGLVISVAPSFFVGEIETVVTADARAVGVTIAVTCPESPPILIGESTSCTGLRSDGQEADIGVSLNRQNGWISWRVDAWNGLLDQ